MAHNVTNARGLDTMLWCPTRDKKIVFIREKELTIMNKAEEGETTKSTHEEEHLGASELPSCVIHRVYYCQGGTLQIQLGSKVMSFSDYIQTY